MDYFGRSCPDTFALINVLKYLFEILVVTLALLIFMEQCTLLRIGDQILNKAASAVDNSNTRRQLHGLKPNIIAKQARSFNGIRIEGIPGHNSRGVQNSPKASWQQIVAWAQHAITLLLNPFSIRQNLVLSVFFRKRYFMRTSRYDAVGKTLMNVPKSFEEAFGENRIVIYGYNRVCRTIPHNPKIFIMRAQVVVNPMNGYPPFKKCAQCLMGQTGKTIGRILAGNPYMRFNRMNILLGQSAENFGDA